MLLKVTAFNKQSHRHVSLRGGEAQNATTWRPAPVQTKNVPALIQTKNVPRYKQKT
jgi:hypothetical protein